MRFSCAAIIALFATTASGFGLNVSPVARPITSLASTNMNPFGTKSLEWKGDESDDPNNANFKKGNLESRLQEADTERRKAREAAEARDRAAEIAREQRQAKIDFMTNMDDDKPAGSVDEFMFKRGSMTCSRCWTAISSDLTASKHA